MQNYRTVCLVSRYLSKVSNKFLSLPYSMISCNAPGNCVKYEVGFALKFQLGIVFTDIKKYKAKALVTAKKWQRNT